MLSDTELIHLCLSNDQRAYQQLYRQYSRPIFNTCLRICRDKHTAQDILQEVFTAAFKKIESFDTGRSFKAWLHGIAINLSLKWVRKEKRHLLQSLDETPQTLEEADDVAEEHADYSPAQILHCIEQLPWMQQLVFNLHAMEELTHKDIAGKLAIPEATVRSHYARARKSIISNLK